MNLRELFGDDGAIEARAAALPVAGLAIDSRSVRPGDVFVALAGSKTDGARFVDQAVANGAVAVAGSDAPSGLAVPFVRLADPRAALARAAARLYPRQPATLVAVTGTSGKTSVAVFARQIWRQFGHAAASLGTIGVVAPTHSTYGTLTTPDPIALHRTLDELAGEGVTHLALEASSHGLDQRRLDGVRVTAGAFTNLSRDHMDYHPSVEHYLATKLRLFSEIVAEGGAAVIAADHPHAIRAIEVARARGLRLLTVGRQGCDIRLVEAAIDGFAQRLVLVHGGKTYRLRLPLVGEFQIENALVASGLVIATGGDAGGTLAALERLDGVPGRLEYVGARDGAPVFVDYAHKPDALAKALAALRPYTRRRLVVVFGAGGDRDPGKRPLMGAIAAAHADAVIVTDDNPRHEDAGAIRAAILAAAPAAREIGDRHEAIRIAVEGLQADDVLLIAGKGHETGQIVGDEVLPFDDRQAVRAALGMGQA
jgi:UDP-N-acetylmuramoyl-L-alanyl-D-glutamate--2,6-diaminopimelate ligase